MGEQFGEVFYDRFEAALDRAYADGATPREVLDDLHKAFYIKYLRSLLN